MPRHVQNRQLPQVNAAGEAKPLKKGDSVGGCLALDNPPATPDEIKKFRKSGTGPLGSPGRHYGIARDAPASPDKVYGRPSNRNDSVEKCFEAMAVKPATMGVVVMPSEMREPLGHAAASPTKLPPETQSPNFRFGKPSIVSEDVKTVIYSAISSSPPSAEPMVQKKHNYTWNSIDPATHRFGAVSERSDAALTVPPCETTLMPSPTKHSRAQLAPLGASRLGGTMPPLPANTVFGHPKKSDDVSLSDLLHGFGTAESTDDRLGKPTTKSVTLRHMRDVDPPASKSRVFGVPSVRTDLPAPKVQKLTSNNDYGDGATAQTALYPSSFDKLGLSRAEVLRPVTLAEVQSIAQKCGLNLKDEEIAASFNYAVAHSPDHQCCMQSFVSALDALNL